MALVSPLAECLEKGYLEEDILENDEEAVEYDRQVIGKIQKEMEIYKNAFRMEGK